MPIGTIGRAQGLQGEVRVNLHNPDSDVIFSVKSVSIEPPAGGSRTHRIVAARSHGRVAIVRLEGVDDRTSAEALRGAKVLVPRRALPGAADDEYYDVDLVGLEVRQVGGGAIGRVVEVDHPPASDVLVIELGVGGYVDVPFVEAWVRRVDIEAGYVEADVAEDLPRRPRR